MEKILSTDADIKTGRQEPVLALELLIIHLCEKG
jgi:DNA polymerase III delta subunit